MAFEPLFESGSLKFLMVIDYAQAARACAKMLAVRNPDRIEAVLAEIVASGMDPWSVAVVAGPIAKTKLVQLGVNVHAAKVLQDSGGVPVPGGVATHSYLYLPGNLADVSIPLVECESLVVSQGTNVVFPVLRKAGNLNLRGGNYSFPVLEGLNSLDMSGPGVVEIPLLLECQRIEAMNGARVLLPALVSATRIDIGNSDGVHAPNLRVVLDDLGVNGSNVSLPGLIYCAHLVISNSAQAILPNLTEAGRIDIYNAGAEVRLDVLTHIYAGLNASGSSGEVISMQALECLAGGCSLANVRLAEPFRSLKRVVGNLDAEDSWDLSMPVLEEILGDLTAPNSRNFSAPALASVALSIKMAGATGANVPLAQGLSPLLIEVVNHVGMAEIEISPDLASDHLNIEPEVA